MRKYPLSLLKDKNIVTFFDFWGKTRRDEKEGGDDYHLLCWHSLDVAAMGYLMVKRNCFGLADYFRQLGISDKEQAAQFFAWLNRPGFPGECFICELRLPDHRCRWKHNKLFLLLP
ncbi:HD domain-containing protein, partial [Escherichia coli]|uniref:HD domain-containing protein n=1 Tax=Escherichia coli TaxID=562 RepID=UPI000B2186E9